MRGREIRDLLSIRARSVPRMRSEGTSCRVRQVGAGWPLRQRQARRDAGRWCVSGVRVLTGRAIARSPRPPRSLPKTRATEATRWLKTRHPTIDCGCGPRSIEPLTVDLRNRPFNRTLLCTSSSVMRCAPRVLGKRDAGAEFPMSKGGAFSARGIHASRCPSASARPAVEALCRRLWSSPPSRRLLRNTIRRRGATHGATAQRREKEQRRVGGGYPDAALRAGLRPAQTPSPR